MPKEDTVGEEAEADAATPASAPQELRSHQALGLARVLKSSPGLLSSLISTTSVMPGIKPQTGVSQGDRWGPRARLGERGCEWPQLSTTPWAD